MTADGIIWDDGMSVGDPGLDRDHRRIIDALNHIVALAAAARRKDAIDEAVHLSVLIAAHVERERLLLRRAGYPDLEGLERKQHDSLERIHELSKLLITDPEHALFIAQTMARAFAGYLTGAEADFSGYLQAMQTAEG
ncbi:bacteriohemerythrin [mine drainage metagenome]|uniref:Bacteriohemerythrin n=1 Tax=mine drainage metagenome TaxID=410659 RepID=A0A1J5QUB4_9ZZZZ